MENSSLLRLPSPPFAMRASLYSVCSLCTQKEYNALNNATAYPISLLNVSRFRVLKNNRQRNVHRPLDCHEDYHLKCGG